MDKVQTSGFKLLGVGVLAFAASIFWPLYSTGHNEPFVFISFTGLFLSPFALLIGALMIRYGDRGDAKLGPLRSEQRKQATLKLAKKLGLICSIIGGVLCVFLLSIMLLRGYRL